MARRIISEIETKVEFFASFVSAMIDAVKEKRYPLAVIYRLATMGGKATVLKMVELAYADWKAEQLFSAPVDYIQPKFDDLKGWFSAGVDSDYKGLHFDPIDVCKRVSRENRIIDFEYICVNRLRGFSNYAMLNEMASNAFRPALYEELLGFAEKYPIEQLKYPIVALGSEALVDGQRNVAYLWADKGRQGLGLISNDDGDFNFMYLVVRS